MVEFSQDLNLRFTGSKAVGQKALYRLSVRRGEIPYFPGGLDIHEFVYDDDLDFSIREVLSDFNADISISGNRVVLAGVSITIPEAVLV